VAIRGSGSFGEVWRRTGSDWEVAVRHGDVSSGEVWRRTGSAREAATSMATGKAAGA
jgi:hypothetical protein